MKNLIPIIVLLIVVLGCDILKFVNKGNRTNSNTARNAKSTPADTPKPEATPNVPAYIALLRKSAGKYPNDIKLLDNVEVRDRLKKMLGPDFTAMQRHWNVESPIEIENDVFKANACEAHNCGDNMYFLFVDMENDNINVYHFENGNMLHYYESGDFRMPKKFGDEIESYK